MSGFSLFPKISSGLEWIAGHSDAVIQFGWNIVAAVILLFVGKFVSRLISSGLEKLLLKRKVDRTIIQFFTALVRYITLAFAVVAALGRVGIETSSIIARIAFQLCRWRTIGLPASIPRRRSGTNWGSHRNGGKGAYFLHHLAHRRQQRSGHSKR